MNQQYFEANKSKYYTPSAAWNGDGPFYDVYAQVIHSFGQPIYAFSYDDELGIFYFLANYLKKDI